MATLPHRPCQGETIHREHSSLLRFTIKLISSFLIRLAQPFFELPAVTLLQADKGIPGS